jgi:hypothetical protein
MWDQYFQLIIRIDFKIQTDRARMQNAERSGPPITMQPRSSNASAEEGSDGHSRSTGIATGWLFTLKLFNKLKLLKKIDFSRRKCLVTFQHQQIRSNAGLGLFAPS